MILAPPREQPLCQPTLAVVSETLQYYWDGNASADERHWMELVSLVDALLVLQILELMPTVPLVVDAASEATRGLTSALLAEHWRHSVTMIPEPRPATRHRLSLFLTERPEREQRCQFIASGQTLPVARGRKPTAIIWDVRSTPAEEVAAQAQQWLAQSAEVVLLALGFGRTGDCPRLAALNAFFSAAGSAHRFRLAREAAEVLGTSGLAVLASGDSELDDVLVRLGRLYSGNFRQLELIWKQNLSAMQTTDVNRQSVTTHPSATFLLHDYHTAKQQADSYRHKVEYLEPELEKLRELSEQRHEYIEDLELRYKKLDELTLARHEYIEELDRRFKELNEIAVARHEYIEYQKSLLETAEQRKQEVQTQLTAAQAELLSTQGERLNLQRMFGTRLHLRCRRIVHAIAPPNSFRYRLWRGFKTVITLGAAR